MKIDNEVVIIDLHMNLMCMALGGPSMVLAISDPETGQVKAIHTHGHELSPQVLAERLRDAADRLERTR